MMLQLRSITQVLFAVLTIFSLSVRAQTNEQSDAANAQGADAPFEVGFHLGYLLPNQIGGVTEIMGLGGLRGGYRLSPGSYLEGGFITGNGYAQQWKNVNLSLRMDIPVENLVGIAYIGADSVYYRPNTGAKSNLVFGGHVGGGLLSHLTGSSWFRTDMKFSFSPGVSLYFGFGFMWRLGGSGGGAGGPT